MLVVPLLLLQNSADASATAGPSAPATAAAPTPPPTTGTTPPPGRPVVIASAPVREVVTTTTTTTAPPRTTTTVPPTTTTTTTTTTVPPTTTTTTRPAPVAGTSVRTTGIVTYYDHPAGHCASPWLPFGTVVQVTNPANGATVTCVVDDREADTERSIDLATSTFAQIAPLPQGVVDARLSW